MSQLVLNPPSTLEVARRSRGLTQTALAHRVGRSQGEISLIESGSQPKPEVLTKIARELEWPYEAELLLKPYDPRDLENLQCTTSLV